MLCDGYEFRAAPKTAPRTLLFPKRGTIHPGYHLTGQPSAKPVFADQTELYYFDIFQRVTSQLLSGYGDSDVWSRLILQMCHEEAYIRHGVVALAALDASTYTRNLMPSYQHVGKTHPEGIKHQRYALKKYGEALKLMQLFSAQDNNTRVRNVMISSLLTTCFECYIGNQEHAMLQAQAGIDVLVEDRFDDWTSVEFPLRFSPLDADLMGIFLRLDVNTMKFRRKLALAPGLHEIRTRKGREGLKMLIPTAFTTLKQARHCFDILIHRRSVQWHSMIQEPFPSPEQQSEDWRVFMRLLEQWFQSFKPFFDSSRLEPKESRIYLASNHMMIRYITAKTCEVSACPEGEDLPPDYCVEDYMQSLTLAQTLLESCNTHGPGKALFVLDEGLDNHLFSIALRSSHGVIRRRAIEMLSKYPRREGVWDSSNCAMVANCIMNIEEQHAGSTYVPKKAKLIIIRHEFNLMTQSAVIQYMKTDREGIKRLQPSITLTMTPVGPDVRVSVPEMLPQVRNHNRLVAT